MSENQSIGKCMITEEDQCSGDLIEIEENREIVKEEIIWRANLRGKPEIHHNFICIKNFDKYHTRYSSWERYCCNPQQKPNHANIRKGTIMIFNF